jgi:4-amino-4-deoxy-L-arabinose transferase-like glycosyltransferase
MLMKPAALVLLTQNRLERLYDALIDPARCERAIMALLAGYVAIWSLYAAIAKGSQDIHPDMAEMAAWSNEIGLGTPKHPPLGAWLVRAWFSAFPREDWSYYLFAMVLAAAALWIVWRISSRHLAPEKRLAGIALLTLVPFYNFHALKFNANAVLTPFWAATTWWFLRSLETRRAGWAALAGTGAAAAMLGKYWSATLLAGLGLAALTDRRRAAYFSSSAPFVTLAVATALLTPHIDWMIANQFVSLSYANEAHQATALTAARSVLGFIAGTLGYIAVPIVLGLIAARPSVTAIRDTSWPHEPERRTLVIAFAAPFLFATVIAIALGVSLNSLWSIPAMTLLPVVLLGSPLMVISRSAAMRLLALAIAFPLVMLVLAPVVAAVTHRAGLENYASHYRLVAGAVERAWDEQTNQPLRIVGSYTSLVNGIAFYIPGQPSTFNIYSPAQTPWITAELIRREGMAMVCPERMTLCVPLMDGFAEHYGAAEQFGAARSKHVVIARSYLGRDNTPVRYEIMIVPPRPD